MDTDFGNKQRKFLSDLLEIPDVFDEASISKLGGNPVFQKIWTLTGMPTISLPLMKGPCDMPIGLQIIGRRGHDTELFRVAQWVEDKLS